MIGEVQSLLIIRLFYVFTMGFKVIGKGFGVPIIFQPLECMAKSLFCWEDMANLVG